MDVTQQILNNEGKHGVSNNTNPNSLSASKNLNFAQGTSLERAVVQNITAFPLKITYSDRVGLFGAENKFIKFQLNIQDSNTTFESIETPDGYLTLLNSRITLSGATENYDTAVELYSGGGNDPNYENAIYVSAIKSPSTTRISVDVNNLRTGNRFVDNWLDVVIYDKNKKVHGYDLMYLKPNDYFYLGFHARTPKQIPYNVEVKIGREYISEFNMTEEQRRYEG